jgi:hypothetical protein
MNNIEKRAVEAVLLSVKMDNVIILLYDGEKFRIFSQPFGGKTFYTLTHSLPTYKRFFPDMDSEDKNEIIHKVLEYPVKEIISNGDVIYSKSKLINRLKNLSFGSKYKKNVSIVNSDIHYLK